MSDLERYHLAANMMCVGELDKDIAVSINVTPQTICNWKRKAEFQRILNEHKHAVNLEHRTKLRGLVTKSIKTLDELLDSEDERVQLRAVSITLDAQGYYKSLSEGYLIQSADVKDIN